MPERKRKRLHVKDGPRRVGAVVRTQNPRSEAGTYTTIPVSQRINDQRRATNVVEE